MGNKRITFPHFFISTSNTMKPEELTDFSKTELTTDIALDTEDFSFKNYDLLDALPIGTYICDVTGAIRKYNQKAVELWGTTPGTLQEEARFCGAYRLYSEEGIYIPHHESAVATCLQDGIAVNNLKFYIERPDQSKLLIQTSITPLKNTRGEITGAITCFYDAVEPKKTNVERQQQDFQEFIDTVAIGIHWVDANGIILWANRTELNMLGYTRDEYIGHHIAEFHIDKNKITDILNRLGNQETLTQCEAALRCKDGSIKTVCINSNVLWEDDRFVHTRCFTIDITEQKQSLLALEESEKRHRQLIDSLPASVYTCNASGTITSFNESSVKLWGRTPQIGVDLWCGSWKIFGIDGAPLPLDSCPMAVALRDGKPVYGKEIVIERPDGTRRHVLPHPTPFVDASGKVVEAVNMLVDITELRNTKLALQLSEDRFRQAADSTPVLFWIAEANGNRTFFNKAWQEFTGNTYPGTESDWKRSIHTQDTSQYLLTYSHAFDKREEYKIEYRLRRSDGIYRWILEHGIPWYTSDGSFEGYLGSCVDIEEKKMMTDALEKEVEKRTRQLKQANHKLQRYNEQLEQFTYAASHDMKEPLRKILFFNNYLHDSLKDLQPKEKDFLERSITATKRMQVLIDDLLVYATTASTIPNLEWVSLDKIVKYVLDAHEVTIEEKNAHIEFDVLPEILGVPFQINQLLDNIIGNALKYSHHQRAPHIAIRYESVPGSTLDLDEADVHTPYHKITIRDNGIGFKPEYATQVFNLFHRLHGRSEFPGSGIGLAICKKIVQNHQGFIKANGRVNEGASFEIYLPQ
jgi:PAS domain S-box-containing protein